MPSWSTTTTPSLEPDARLTASAPEPRRASLGMVALAAVAVLLVWRVHDLLLVAFIAILLAVYLGGVTDLFCRFLKVPRSLMLLLTLILTLTAVIGIGVLVAPAVVGQTEDLIAAVPTYLAALDRMVQDLANSSEVLRRTAIASESGLITVALNDAMDFLRRSFFSYAAGTGRLVIDGVAVMAMALYLALRPTPYVSGMLNVVPPRHRSMVRAIMSDLGDTLRSWVGAQLLAMVVLAVTTAVGLLILGVPYWMAFSLLAGIAVMVPFFGSITSTVLPALLVLPVRGPIAALAVALVGVVVHVVEANVVHPLIMQHRVALPPALTILFVLVMGALAGLLGMIVAVPLLATLVVLVRHVLIYQTYGERPEGQAYHAVLLPARLSSQTVVAPTT